MKKQLLVLLAAVAFISLGSWAVASNMVVGEADKCYLATASMVMQPGCRYEVITDDLAVFIREIDIATNQVIQTESGVCSHVNPMKTHCM